jgi:hypothetical protein
VQIQGSSRQSRQWGRPSFPVPSVTCRYLKLNETWVQNDSETLTTTVLFFFIMVFWTLYCSCRFIFSHKLPFVYLIFCMVTGFSERQALLHARSPFKGLRHTRYHAVGSGKALGGLGNVISRWCQTAKTRCMVSLCHLPVSREFPQYSIKAIANLLMVCNAFALHRNMISTLL